MTNERDSLDMTPVAQLARFRERALRNAEAEDANGQPSQRSYGEAYAYGVAIGVVSNGTLSGVR